MGWLSQRGRHRLRKRQSSACGKLMRYETRAERMAERAEPGIPQQTADGATHEVPSEAETLETPTSMLDVHSPHQALHTWKDFFIHIATIVVGLFIAVALEQSVEAINRRHEAAALREDLRQESRQILADARNTEAAHLYEIRWVAARIAQTQRALQDRHPVEPRAANDMPIYASPDIPIWRSAKAGGRVSLLSKGEVNAYAEIEYVQTHLDEMEVVKNSARYAVKSFNRQFPLLPNGDPDFSSASTADLHAYLGLLATAYESLEAYIHWLRIIIGAETAVVDGRTKLDEIYASERKSGGGDILQNFM
jgi:hypothetical protein